MIRTEPYGGGVRWHCTECDTNISIPGHKFPGTRWTNGTPPKRCSKCDKRYNYHIKLDLEILLGEENSARVREAIDLNKEALAEAITKILEGQDALLSKWTARRWLVGDSTRQDLLRRQFEGRQIRTSR